MPTHRWKAGHIALGLAVLTLTGACAELAPDSPLANARRSPEALGGAAVDAIANGDEDALRSLMITREEYESLLWPVLPDREQMPFDFAWSVTAPRSRKARRAAITTYQGVPMELERVELGHDVERYPEFTLYRRSRMWVRPHDTGDVGMMPLMDTLVEMDGGWKFMNFVEDA